MFLIDSLLISGLRWTLDTIRTAADAEMNDDSALRDQLLEAEMRRELGEISDDEFRAVEADLLERIRRIRDARTGGSDAIAFDSGAIHRPADGSLTVEATLAGDFHEPPDVPVPAGSARSRAAAPRAPRRSHRRRRR